MDIINDHVHQGQRTGKNKLRKFTFETQVLALSDDELTDLAEKLNKLGIQFDPFSGKLTKEDQELISSLQLELFLDDPFQFTNIVLKRLDEIETELKKRNH